MFFFILFYSFRTLEIKDSIRASDEFDVLALQLSCIQVVELSGEFLAIIIAQVVRQWLYQYTKMTAGTCEESTNHDR